MKRSRSSVGGFLASFALCTIPVQVVAQEEVKELEKENSTLKLDLATSRLAEANLQTALNELTEAKEQADADKETAEQQTKDAQEDVKKAETEKEEAEKKLSLAELNNKALQLFESNGISIGAAGIVATNSLVVDDRNDRQVRVGAMPYVMFRPAYWFNKPEQNVYCANRHRQLTAVEVDKLTWEAAKQRAELYFQVRVAPAQTKEQLIELLNGDTNNVSANAETWWPELESYHTGQNDNATESEKAAGELARQRLLVAISKEVIKWEPVVPAGCGGRRVGVFVGAPTLVGAFSKDVERTETQVVPNPSDTTMQQSVEVTTTETIETRPLIAIGAGFSPTQHLAIVAGLTIQTPDPLSDGFIARFGFVAGLSVQTDILNQLGAFY